MILHHYGRDRQTCDNNRVRQATQFRQPYYMNNKHRDEIQYYYIGRKNKAGKDNDITWRTGNAKQSRSEIGHRGRNNGERMKKNDER